MSDLSVYTGVFEVAESVGGSFKVIRAKESLKKGIWVHTLVLKTVPKTQIWHISASRQDK